MGRAAFGQSDESLNCCAPRRRVEEAALYTDTGRARDEFGSGGGGGVRPIVNIARSVNGSENPRKGIENPREWCENPTKGSENPRKGTENPKERH